MRSPAQHPSRLGAPERGLDLELGIGATPPPAARARVESHHDRRGATAAALAVELAPSGPDSSEPPVSSGAVPKRPAPSGEGIAPQRVAAPSRAKKVSLPPAPEGKAPLFRSGAPGDSDAPPASGGARVLGAGGAAGAPAALFDAEDDEEWEGGGALDVGLDYGSEAPPPLKAEPKRTAPASSPDPAFDLHDDDPGPPPASTRGSPRPQPAQVVTAQPVFSPDEIEVVAQYGPVPPNPLLAPLYALRVFQRRRALVGLLSLARRTHEQATSALRGKLTTIVDRVVAKASPDQVQGVMGPIRAAEQKLADRKAQLEAASGQFASQVKTLQQELEAEGKKKQQLERDRNMAQIKVEDAVHKRAQAAAELKRLNVEIEAAHEAAAKAAGKDATFAPPEHAKRIAALEAQRAKLSEQVKGRDKAVTDARAELKERQRAISILEARVNAIHGRQARMEQEAGQAQNLGLTCLKQAQNERLVAYEVAFDAIVAQAPHLIDDATASEVADVKRQIAQCDADLAKQELAVDAYDRAAVKRGVAIAIALAILVVLALISVARVG